ncbi:MAG: YtxH domain-containing protein [Nostocaceae cyanobacterium]|nr:YtxH domain-containing protein [Nostocaceae cyanobacterium]
MSNKNSGVFIGGMMLGAAIGTLTGLLVAPRTGRETRKLLQKSASALPEIAEDISTSVQMGTDRISETARANWDGTLTRLKEAIAAGIEASQRENQAMKRQNLATIDSESYPSVADR